MEIATVIATISGAVSTLGQLREATKTLQNAELKTIIAELADRLADAKLQVAELKDELSTLRTENQELKQKQETGKPTVQWGCYKFLGDEQLYCPACYDTKGKKHLTTRLNSQRRQCTVCKVQLGAG